MENDNFEDIEINLSEPTYTQPDKGTDATQMPPKNEIPKTHGEAPCGCGHHHHHPELKSENKVCWLNGPFGCIAGGFAGCVIIPFILFCIMCLCIGAAFKSTGSPSSPVPSSSDYIAVVHIEGEMLTGESDLGFFGGTGISYSGSVSKLIKKAADDKKAKAILLKINSPGGTPVAAEEIGEAIGYAKAKKPVWTSIGDLGASAAYWVSSQTNKIYVYKTTLTGSIGVIMQGVDYSKLMDKIGVSSKVIKSGKYKDIGSGSRPMTDEERRLLQAMLDSTYNVFIDTVAEGRGMPREQVKQLAEGMIYTGPQAVNNKLADKVGSYETCLDDLAKEVNMKKPVTKDMGKGDFWSQIMEQDLKNLLNIYLINQLKYFTTDNQLSLR
ncbi:MAG: signal peptide peptidase SppA [Abditibacteriota bacterium]|nr:signal peptide peptidase SppA [Abditibacteriota bacterium]